MGNAGGNNITINVENMQVRDDNDIKKISQELYRLSKRDNRMRLGGAV